MTLFCTCQNHLNCTMIAYTISPINWIINHVCIYFDSGVLNAWVSGHTFKKQSLCFNTKKQYSHQRVFLNSYNLKNVLGNRLIVTETAFTASVKCSPWGKGSNCRL